MKNNHFPPKLLFVIVGIASTVWFLIRVIPKPSRASYPCMQVAAPLMSGFVIYLISLGGLMLALGKVRQNLIRARYTSVGIFLLVAFMALVLSLTHNTPDSYAGSPAKTGPDDGPNQPIGQGGGVNPGRVIWVWDPKATNADCVNVFDFYKPENTNQGVVNRMVVDGVKKLSGKSNLHESWDALFAISIIRRTRMTKVIPRGRKFLSK